MNRPLCNKNLLDSSVGIVVRTADTGIESSNPTQGAPFFFHRLFSKKRFLPFKFAFFSKVIEMFFGLHNTLYHIPKGESNFFEGDYPTCCW